MAAGLNVAIVGATGVVGRTFLSLLAERAFPVQSIRLMASPRSAGKHLDFDGTSIEIEALQTASFAGVDVAFFSAGSEQKAHALRAAREGTVVIDNSSAFRMDPDVPLVVPQVNGDTALAHRGIIANPNCSTIILLMALAPIERQVPIERIVVSTYQAVSGSGAAALEELQRQADEERDGKPLTSSVYPVPIHGNVIPFVQAFDTDGLTTEEWKLVRETQRILGRPELAISATCVRVPVRRAHSEAVNLLLERPVTPDEVRAWLSAAEGVRVIDDPSTLSFPTPRDADGGDDVLVGRIRRDPGHGRGLDLWVTGDQIRKGAAQNAVEIAELLVARGALDGKPA